MNRPTATILLFVTLSVPALTVARQHDPISLSQSSDGDAGDTLRATTPPQISSTLSKEELRELPYRKTDDLLHLMPGFVRHNGNLHVRGGRPGELQYLVDGMPVVNPYTNRPFVRPLPEAMEMLEANTGPVSSSLGGWNSGIVSFGMRSGEEALAVTVDYQTDGLVRPGGKFLGTTSAGYRRATVTAGGPFPFELPLRFFAAAELEAMENRTPLWLSPFSYRLTTDFSDPRDEGVPLPRVVEMPENHLPGNRGERTTVQGTLDYLIPDVPLTLRFTGIYESERATRGAEWGAALTRLFVQRRNPEERTSSGFAALSARASPWPGGDVEVSAGWRTRGRSFHDPDFGEEWTKYTDSAANAAAGYPGFPRRWNGPFDYSSIFSFWFPHEAAPNQFFLRETQNGWIVRAMATQRVNDSWTLRAGGSADFWTIRKFRIGSEPTSSGRFGSSFSTLTWLMSYLYGFNGNEPRTFPDEATRRVLVAQRGRIDHFGYTVDGVETDDGPDAPRRPRFLSGFAEAEWRGSSLEATAGVRYERISTDIPAVPLNEPLPYDQALDVLDERGLRTQDPVGFLLPRITVSFIAGTNTTLRAGFGKSVQMPPLELLYHGNAFLSRTVSPLTSGNALLTPVPYAAGPEKATTYSFDFVHRIRGNLSVRGALFQKELRDQLTVRRREAVIGAATLNVTSWVNADRATVRGLELGVRHQTTRGIRIALDYALTSAKGTGSDPTSSVGAVEQSVPFTETILSPVEYQPEHLLRLRIDGQFAGEDFLLSGLGGSVVATYTSGHPYTRLQLQQFLGSATPWTIGVLTFADPRTAQPTEPLNSSRTPAVFNVDIAVSKMFSIGPVGLEVYVHVFNLLNTRQVLNVYPETGTAATDGWLTSEAASWFTGVYNSPEFVPFYRDINEANRWAYASVTGNDLWGPPRQIRVGLKAVL